ncbi:polyprenyl synthetase family protein [soil metagenome]
MTATEGRPDVADPSGVRPAAPAHLLAHYGELVDAGVRRALRGDDGGPLDEAVAAYPSRPGKGLRSALLLASCEAFGGDLRDGLPAAVSLELMHNAFLVHDDVEDASTRRRGGPALHVEYGIPLAVHAGDALAVRAVVPLLDQPRLSASLVQRVIREFLDTATRTLEGQSMELAWRGDPSRTVEPEDYLRLVLHKSCWYTTIYPLRAGCLIGSRGGVSLGPLTTFGFLLGAAFQVRDDILDLVGDPDAHGKEPRADLREGKRTLMLVHLLGAAGEEERRWLEHFLAMPPAQRSRTDVDTVFELMRRHGSVEVASAWADGLVAGARAVFPSAFELAVSPFHAHFVEQVIDFVVTRGS